MFSLYSNFGEIYLDCLMEKWYKKKATEEVGGVDV
jgi:hypothetical protein